MFDTMLRMGGALLDTLLASIDELDAIDLDSLTDAELHDAVVGLGAVAARLEAQWCRLIGRWDNRRGVGRRRLQGGRRPLGPGDPSAP